MRQPHITQRAFEIACACGSIAEVERRLIREGYAQVKAQLGVRQIRSEIVSRLNPALKHSVPKPAGWLDPGQGRAAPGSPKRDGPSRLGRLRG